MADFAAGSRGEQRSANSVAGNIADGDVTDVGHGQEDLAVVSTDRSNRMIAHVDFDAFIVQGSREQTFVNAPGEIEIRLKQRMMRDPIVGR